MYLVDASKAKDLVQNAVWMLGNMDNVRRQLMSTINEVDEIEEQEHEDALGCSLVTSSLSMGARRPGSQDNKTMKELFASLKKMEEDPGSLN